jgi:hypothetical protein
MTDTSISRELLGKIVDEVFDGAIEDASVIEEIYAVIMADRAALSVPIDPKAEVDGRANADDVFGEWWPQTNPSQPDEAFRQLLLIKHLAEYTTERNWADKRLYIIQAASRALSTTKPAQGDGELRKALEWMRDRDDRNGSLPEAYRQKIDAALAANEDAQDRMRKALEPFAKRAERFDDIPGVYRCDDNVEIWQDGNWRCDLTVGDLREARAALAAHGDDAQEGTPKTWGEWERKQQTGEGK